jgi:hypothetical protein
MMGKNDLEEPLFNLRELQEINHCLHYARGTCHGTDGHIRMVIIEKLVWALFNLDQNTSDWDALQDVHEKVM